MITPFDAETLAAISASLRGGQYNLLFGSGVSLDSKNAKGRAVPSAEALRVDLCNLKNAKTSSTLQRVYSYLTPEEVKEQIVGPFSGCSPGASLLKVPSFIWRRAFSFNVDDAFEGAYSLPGALQNLITYNFSDQYAEVRERAELPIVHLHGWVGRPDNGFVFSISEYVRQLVPINPWMVVLSQFLAVEPFIIAGTSLEETDLEYYLAHRTPVTARPDRGPSILVEPFPDAGTKRDCKKYGLKLFHGTTEEFFDYLDKAVPGRQSAFDLLPASTVSLFPAGVSKNIVSSFAADFETVPETFIEKSDASRFLYGHPPSWSDLINHLDVGRAVTSRLLQYLNQRLEVDKGGARLLLMLDEPGGGKTTILRRVAREFAEQGVRVVTCSALSRLDAQATSEAVNLIENPLVVVIDNFADQVRSIVDAIERIKKPDVVFICAERAYRWNYLRQALSGLEYKLMDGLPMAASESESLIDLYQHAGLVGSAEALTKKKDFAKRISKDPIAVACCRILNNFHPLERIVQSVTEAATKVELTRYLTVALAHYCLRGGVRYDVLASVSGREGWDEQFETTRPLPLDYFEGSEQTFVVPLNGTIASQVLDYYARNNRKALLKVFVDLANAIAPRVNRKAVMNRTPESRLAGRLFDFDQVAMEFLKEDAPSFYAQTKKNWQWNSRYWEQVALLHLSQSQLATSIDARSDAITSAVTHARHAVAIERHPLTMTTLAKILMAQLGQPGVPGVATYDEAFGLLIESIDKEHQWRHVNAHGFIGLFRGTIEYMKLGGMPTLQQRDKLRQMMREAKVTFRGDWDISEAIRMTSELVG